MKTTTSSTRIAQLTAQIDRAFDRDVYARILARRAAAAESRVRRELQLASCHPLEIILGYVEPHTSGRSHYWTTPSGKTEVRHPRAYGWPTRYHHSTLRGVVGADYLASIA
jgi:hypothetical protein